MSVRELIRNECYFRVRNGLEEMQRTLVEQTRSTGRFTRENVFRIEIPTDEFGDWEKIENMKSPDEYFEITSVEKFESVAREVVTVSIAFKVPYSHMTKKGIVSSMWRSVRNWVADGQR